MNENSNLKIHDIKDIVEIPDTSFFIFLALCFIGFVLLLSLIIYIIKMFKNRKQNIKKIYLEKLKNIDYSDTKKSAYTITKYLRLLVSNETEENYASQLIEELEKYKYKKNVNDFNIAIKSKVDTFMDMIDV